MERTYDGIEDTLDKNYFAGSTVEYTLPPGIYEVSDINLMLKPLLPIQAKLKITIDDIKLRSNLTTNKTKRSTRRSFFNTILGFTLSHSRPLGDIKGFIQKVRGAYESLKPNNITRMDKNHLTCDCDNGSIVFGIREPIMYSFALDQPPVIKDTNNQQLNILKR